MALGFAILGDRWIILVGGANLCGVHLLVYKGTAADTGLQMFLVSLVLVMARTIQKESGELLHELILCRRSWTWHSWKIGLDIRHSAHAP